MNQELSGTKLALIEAAGALFAELGLDGASTRTIAERAGTNVAAISYHFGGKENLYLECVRYSVSCKTMGWTERAKRIRQHLEGGASLKEALATEIRGHLAEVFEKELPPWHMKLITRTLLEPSPTLRALNQDIFTPQFEALVNLAMELNPALSLDQAKQWTDTLFAQTIFVSLTRVVILEYEGWESFPQAYLDRVADHTAMLLTIALRPNEGGAA